jgi:hypothetical protein
MLPPTFSRGAVCIKQLATELRFSASTGHLHAWLIQTKVEEKGAVFFPLSYSTAGKFQLRQRDTVSFPCMPCQLLKTFPLSKQ